MRLRFAAALFLSMGAGASGYAQTVISANDAHSILVGGKQVLPTPLLPDSVSTLAQGSDGLWHVRNSIAAHASVIGPPTAIGMTPDGKTVFVASASTADPVNNAIAPDDRISVIDVSGGKPVLVQTIAAVPGATTLRLTPDGHHLLVAGGKSGALAWFRFDGRTLSQRKIIQLPGKPGFPGGLAILPDGKTAMVSLWQADVLYRLMISGDTIRVDPKPLQLGPGPWTIRLTPDARYAAINILGHGEGLPGEIAMLDLSTYPWRVVQRVPVPNAPEGMDIAPDGSALAVVSQNGSAMPPASPRYNARGIVTVFTLHDGHLTQAAQAPGPLWPQGLIFAPDGRSILAQGVMDHALRTLSWDGKTLSVKGDAALPGGGADLERQH